MTARIDRLLDKRLIFVTGKGGVGKSTVSAALGVAAARQGKRTIICEVAQQEPISHLFERPTTRPRGVPSASDQDPAGLRAAVQEPDLHLLRSRNTRPARASHDRQGLGARPARSQSEEG